MAKKRGHGEGSIYRRASDGRWVGAVTLPDGKRRYCSGRKRAEVAAQVDQIRQAIAAGLPVQQSPRTVGEFAAEWLAGTVALRRNPNTVKTYTIMWNRHMEPALGKVKLSHLSVRQVQQFLDGKLAEGLAPRSVAMMRAILVALLKQAEVYELVGRNVARLTEPPEIGEGMRHPLMPEGLPRFLQAVSGHRLEALYLVALGAGLRIGEALGLCWDHVELGPGMIRIQHQMEYRGGRYLFTEPKRRASKRTVPLPGFAADALRRHRIRQETHGLQVPPMPGWESLVFRGSEGGPIHENVARSGLRRICRQAGMAPMTFHDLRRSYGTLLNHLKVDPSTIQALMGHAHVATTLGVYTSPVPEDQWAAVRSLHQLVTR